MSSVILPMAWINGDLEFSAGKKSVRGEEKMREEEKWLAPKRAFNVFTHNRLVVLCCFTDVDIKAQFQKRVSSPRQTLKLYFVEVLTYA